MVILPESSFLKKKIKCYHFDLPFFLHLGASAINGFKLKEVNFF